MARKKQSTRRIKFSYISLTVTLILFLAVAISRRQESEVLVPRETPTPRATSSLNIEPEITIDREDGIVNVATGPGGVILPKDLLEPTL